MARFAKLPRKERNRRSAAAWAAFQPIGDDDSVPEGAEAHFDFASDSYWTEADGELTAADVIASTTAITPGVGYTGGVSAVSLIGPGLAALSTNMTIVLRGRIITSGPEASAQGSVDLVSIADSEDFNSGGGFGVSYQWDEAIPQVDDYYGVANVYDTGQSFLEVAAASQTGTSEPEIRFDSAYTLTPTKLSVSTTGQAVVTNAITISFAIGYAELKSALNPLTNLHFALESITVYPPKLDAELPALSAL